MGGAPTKQASNGKKVVIAVSAAVAVVAAGFTVYKIMRRRKQKTNVVTTKSAIIHKPVEFHVSVDSSTIGKHWIDQYSNLT